MERVIVIRKSRAYAVKFYYNFVELIVCYFNVIYVCLWYLPFGRISIGQGFL